MVPDTQRRSLAVCAAMALGLLAACGAPAPARPDGGVPGGDAGGATDSGADGGSPADAGLFDAGSPDAGPPDAGPVDAGFLEDAGPLDAGPRDAGAPDSGLTDSGTPDAGPCPDPFEPNDTAAQAATPPPGSTGGLEICGADVDWFELNLTPSRLVSVGMLAPLLTGDLDLSTFDSTSQCVGGRSPGTCASATRFDETSEEFQTVVNARDAGTKNYRFRVSGFQGAASGYTLSVEDLSWTDGRDCGAPHSVPDCTGQPDAGGRLLQAPYAALDDGWLGDGYRLDAPANYRFARRELLMLLRYAIHQTQIRFPNTLALGVLDASQRDGLTPGFDVGMPRHPQGTHDQGGSVDVAYFTTLAGGSIPYNRLRIVCDADQGSNDGASCTSAATTLHVVDLPRQVYFLAKLYESPRLRVIGVDAVIAPLLQQEADRQLGLGWISQPERDAFFAKLGFGPGWPFQHHNIHLSMLWW